MTVAALALLLQASPLVATDNIDRALDAALDFDSRAYYQICGSQERRRVFEALQARAQALNGKNDVRKGQDLTIRYVDRRAQGRCSEPSRFSDTIRAWSASLDKIAVALGGAK
ncbi:MAG: hypothetical protein ABW023_10785 [Sphingomonas sp.]